MDILFQIIPLALVAGGFWYLYTLIKSQKSGSESQKIMLELMRDLRTEMRGGLDKNSESVQKRLDETLKLLDQQFHNVRKSVDTRISENTKTMSDRLDSSAKVMNGLMEELGRVKEIGPNIKQLQETLSGQKLRGNLGEQVMNDLIAQIIPHAHYEFQHRFQSGDIVDAIIKTQNGIIPIDSKFPLENFKQLINAPDEKTKESASKVFVRDVKKHIKDIHNKYILPEEGTMDFAFMYVPADSVFFEIIVNNPVLSEFAQEKRVFIVSPSMFYSSLQVILLSFQSQKFEEHAKQVLQLIQGVKKESVKFGESVSTLHKHVNNAKNKMDEVYTGYQHLDTKIHQIDGSSSIEIPEHIEEEEKEEILV